MGEQSVRIHAPVYARAIPKALIDATGARTIRLASSPSLRPRLRSNGLSVFGYYLGSFRLANGTQAFVALTSTEQDIAFVPLTDGSTVLLSVEDAEGFVKALN